MPSAWDTLPGDEAENPHFHFFRSVTISSLACFFDYGFWSYEILQLSHHHPALFHAIAAFGSTHHGYLTDTTSYAIPRNCTDLDMQFSLKQFNKSISAVSKLLSRGENSFLEQQVILTTCILFSCLSALQGKQLQAFILINNGLKMLHQWKLNSRGSHNAGNNVAMDMLLLMFVRLDTQIRPYLAGQEATLQWTEASFVPLATDVPYQTLLEAYVDLELIFNRGMRIFLNEEYCLPVLSPHALEEKEAIIHQLQIWDRELSALLSTKGLPATESDENALNLLHLRRGFATAILAWDTTQGERAHDNLTPIYRKLLNLTVRVLRQQHNPVDVFHPLEERHPNFNLAAMTTEPLYWIGIRCRQPRLRRQALRLLQLYPRREGICESMAGANVVEKVIEIEENGCPRRARMGTDKCNSHSSSVTSVSPSCPPAINDSVSSEGASSEDREATPIFSSCSKHGKWVCERHRVAVYQFLLPTERQCKHVMWTVEDLALGRAGNQTSYLWW